MRHGNRSPGTLVTIRATLRRLANAMLSVASEDGHGVAVLVRTALEAMALGIPRAAFRPSLNSKGSSDANAKANVEAHLE
jgi:hypothetical protein